jgi:hypothetical protein
METMSEVGKEAERIGISRPVFTLGTANPACTAAFYARISGIRENPLKYTDPDGNYVINATDTAFVVRSEDGEYILLEKGGKLSGKIDGIIMPNRAIIKISDNNIGEKLTRDILGTREINVKISGTKEDGYTYAFEDKRSEILNDIGDTIKGNTGLSSGSYGPNDLPNELKDWRNDAESLEYGYGPSSTWENQAEAIKGFLNGSYPVDWEQHFPQE